MELNYTTAREAATINTYGGFIGSNDGQIWFEVNSYNDAKVVIHINFNGTFCGPHIN